MSKVVVYGETPDRLARAVSAARALNAEVVAVTVGLTDADVAQCGAAKAIIVDAADEGVARPCIERYAKQVADIVADEDAQAFVAASGYGEQTMASMVAGYLDWPMESDVASLEGEPGAISVSRLLYGGSVVRKEKVSAPAAITFSGSLFDPASGAVTVEHVPALADDRMEVLSAEAEQRSGADITKAKRIVGIGMGLRTDDDLALARKLAAAMDAEVGGTRGTSEERGWLPEYIGISGVSVQPDIYLAMGVAGQIQHVFGIRGAKTIVAVNNNADAPIFKVADYGIVGDFHDVVPALIEALG
jgi:electron transfer flavoprotein alpha subunit